MPDEVWEHVEACEPLKGAVICAESVPRPDVVAGKPQGIFVGRSLLTGRAVCLLFLDGGRVTRSIPTGGLEAFDWDKHQADHPGDSGSWEVDAGQLSIAWGDGGVHRGPLTVHPTGIEFYGKRYSRPVMVERTDLVGSWEAAYGTAPWGGEGLVALSNLAIDAEGRYTWAETVGGVVDGAASAGSGATSGTLAVSGQTMTFTSGDGSVIVCTFLPVAGDPLEAFSLDGGMFTRAS